jgi:chlorophyll(ide) b reductase
MPNIVVTGGSAGLGKALTHEFCKTRNNVLIVGRNKSALIETRNHMANNTSGQCFILKCNVQEKDDLIKLADYAQDLFKGEIDHWINNAGICEGPIQFINSTVDDVEQVIKTNVLGVIMGTKIAHNIKSKNIYAVSGHGSDFSKTPDFSLYGSSKACISHFYSTLIEEANNDKNKTSNFHIIAPGIIKSDLSKNLLEYDGLNDITKYIINTIAQNPDDVAQKIAPKILSISGNGSTIRPFF